MKGPDGRSRSIYRGSVTTAASAATHWSSRSAWAMRPRVAQVTVSWPTSGTTQTFRDVPADQMIVITEGEASFNVVKQKAIKPPAS